MLSRESVQLSVSTPDFESVQLSVSTPNFLNIMGVSKSDLYLFQFFNVGFKPNFFKNTFKQTHLLWKNRSMFFRSFLTWQFNTRQKLF